MKYRNKKTGSIIDVECRLIDELYELIDEKTKEEVSPEETSSEELGENTPAPETTKEPEETSSEALEENTQAPKTAKEPAKTTKKAKK